MKLEKIIKKDETPRQRWYEDACAAAHALDLLGERWSMLVMRELMFGAKRFGDLRASLPGISANILTQRLETLEDAGVLRKHKLPPPASAQVYELTAWGLESEPIFQALGRWAARSPAHDPTLPFSAASLLLSFRTLLDREKAAGLEARLGFRLGAEGFVGRLVDGLIALERGEPEGADVIFTGAPSIIAAAIYGGQPFAALERAGMLTIEGDRTLAEKFAGLFPLPAKAGLIVGRGAGKGTTRRVAEQATGGRAFVRAGTKP